MYPKIDVFINGIYMYSTKMHRTCSDAIKAARSKKCLCIKSYPEDLYITIKENDRIIAKYNPA